MELVDSNNCYIVDNADELLAALKIKAPRILITKSFKHEFLKNTELPLTETERMGFDLGFRGGAGIASAPFFHLINFFSKDSKQQKKIDSRMRSYLLKKQDTDDLLLYLRQLDY